MPVCPAHGAASPQRVALVDEVDAAGRAVQPVEHVRHARVGLPERDLPRSRYERVVRHAIAGDTLSVESERYKATGMKGWSQVVFRRERDGRREVHQGAEGTVPADRDDPDGRREP